MKWNRLFSFLTALLGVTLCLPALGQGVIVFKKDGTSQKYPYEQLDSIVTYNSETTEPTVPENVKECTVYGVTFRMVQVKGGTFTMGATNEQLTPNDNEKPAHTVTLSDFYISETEVTQELWEAVMGTNPSDFTGNYQCPVENVSWNDCHDFLEKLNELTGMNFELPTEAQWEYAARGGALSKGYRYSGSDIVGEVAWYKGNSSKTQPVKSKKPNELGLYDMSGNVEEWCQDGYSEYSSSPQTNPIGSGYSKIARGGSWQSDAGVCRVACRKQEMAHYPTWTRGFRLALPNYY